MSRQNKIITAVSPRVAKIGYKFILNAPAEECKSCKLYRVCAGNSSLKVGRSYKIVEVREAHHKCLLDEDGVVIVAVVEAEYNVLIPINYAVEGAIITFNPKPKSNVCNICKYESLCHPEAFKKGDKIIISKLMSNKVNCEYAGKLVLASCLRAF